ncbi:hypothetical protein Ga0061061_11638 [Chelatococcus sambhunathii]|uniref:Uncharacterized protein n=1 Tax=Chelatococcus sambhunathii TaxID=363953 RepID=A0ABM9U9M9_9HYPH|nr:hypothetical protein [Chelatococcus sambhunathii]CUA90895.1 hypothetical protein Ga0061061_11638 [Chelatococcus sambhunathii]
MSEPHTVTLQHILAIRSVGYNKIESCANAYTVYGVLLIDDLSGSTKQVAGSLHFFSGGKQDNTLALVPTGPGGLDRFKEMGADLNVIDRERVIAARAMSTEVCQTLERLLLIPRETKLEMSISVDLPEFFLEGEIRKSGEITGLVVAIVNEF